MALSLAAILTLTHRWITQRAAEDVGIRLEQCRETLSRVHGHAVNERASRIARLSIEPRFRALLEIDDQKTLRYAADEIRTELDTAAFAFVAGDRRILAWSGIGQDEAGNALQKRSIDHENHVSYFFVGDQLVEHHLVAVRSGTGGAGYLAAMYRMDADVLNEYEIAIGNELSIRRGPPAPDEALANSNSAALSISLDAAFVISVDPHETTRSLRAAFRTLVVITSAMVGVGAIVLIILAHYFARPVDHLAQMTQLVGSGDLDVRAEIAGAPEFRTLARHFNLMVESIEKYQDELTDYTQRLEAEIHEKTRQTELLDQEIGQHKHTMGKLKLAAETAEAANRAKSEFLSNMSHELRTPLHHIMSFSGFGLRKCSPENLDKIKLFFEKIQQSGETLLCLVNDLLDLAKLESGHTEYTMAYTDFNALVSGVKDEFTESGEQDVAFDFKPISGGAGVDLDAFRIKQVVRNILNNAIKFTPPGGRVHLEAVRHDDGIRLSVHDQGEGIPTDELDTVFEKFIQSSATNDGSGGTGLGLAICREIVRGHGGSIWAENNGDGGATFTIELPCVARSEDGGVKREDGGVRTEE